MADSDTPPIPEPKSGMGAVFSSMTKSYIASSSTSAKQYTSEMSGKAASAAMKETFGNGVVGNYSSTKSGDSSSSSTSSQSNSEQQFEMQSSKPIQGSSVVAAINLMNQQQIGAITTLNKNVMEGVKQNSIVNQSINKLINISSSISSRIDKTNQLLEGISDYFDKEGYGSGKGNNGSGSGSGGPSSSDPEFKKLGSVSAVSDFLIGSSHSRSRRGAMRLPYASAG